MPVILLSVARRIGPYVAVLILGFGAGAWLSYRIEHAAVARVQVTLARQQAANAQAAATANAKAAAELQAANERADHAEAALSAARSTATTSVSQEVAKIRREASVKGNDGPVAPVLAHALSTVANSP